MNMTDRAPAGEQRGVEWRWLAVIFCSALLFRLFFAFVLPSLSSDGKAYDRIALNLLSGNGFSESLESPFIPDVIRDPLYPFFLASIYRVFGHSLTVVRILQALLSAVTAIFIYWIGRNLFGRKMGLAAAALAALHLPSLVLVADILTETLYIFLVVVGTWLVLHWQQESWRSVVAAGILFGLAALTRTELLIYPFLLLGGLFFLSRRESKLARNAVLIAAVMGCLLLPWVVRNYAVTGRIQLRDPQAMYASLVLGSGRDFADPYYQEVYRYGGGAMPQDVMADYQKRVIARYIDDVRADPGRYLVRRAVEVFRAWTYGNAGLGFTDSPLLDSLQKGYYLNFLGRVTLFALYGPIILAFDLFGVLRSLRINRKALLLLVHPILITAITLPMHADGRYTLPGQLLLLPLCALGLVATRDWATARFAFTRRASRMPFGRPTDESSPVHSEK